MHRFFILAAAVWLCAATASAQTKVTGTAQCGKPDPQHLVPVGDHPDHSLGVAQFKCTYTKPMEIGGDKSKDGVSTETTDVSGNSSRARGFHVATMESGDKFFVWYQGTGTSKDGAPVELKGNWGFTGGSGKLKGIKGKGTYTCAPAGDMLSCEVEGEYQLAK
ncbi:MAG: hypothetical protein AUH86_12125 [Acidobacteria bacterium 13_1_40CM_4_58_4]|nr:MAG: hypothetical protein AUH86_12125 [Acidobacteria bacterium 13_1_40CM_4_58_4]